MTKFSELKKQYEGKTITSEEYQEIMDNNKVSTDFAGKMSNGRMFLIYDNNSNDVFRIFIK